MAKVRSKKIVGLLVAVVTLLTFCIPALAFPGSAGLHAVAAAPAIVAAENAPGYTYVTNYSGNGRTSYLHVTLDDAARAEYARIGADGYYVEVWCNFEGATRYELYLNGQFVKRQSTALSDFVTFYVEDDRPAVWQILIYDNTGTAKTTWGHVYYS